MLAPLPPAQSVPLTTPSGLNAHANQSGQILAHHILEHIRIRRAEDECPAAGATTVAACSLSIAALQRGGSQMV